MTTNNIDDMTPDEILAEAESSTSALRAWIDAIGQARDTQPERLAKARSEADEARGWSLIEEPWDTLISALPTCNSDGQRTGDSLVLPGGNALMMFEMGLAAAEADIEDADGGDQ